MKKGYLILLFFLIFCFGYDISLNLAQENKDLLEVEKTISDYVNAHFFGEADQVMQFVSLNYSDIRNGKPVDYAQFRSDVINFIDNFRQRLADLAVTNVKISKYEIQDNKANVEFEYDVKAFNLDTLREDHLIRKRICTLIKEDGRWKIIKLNY